MKGIVSEVKKVAFGELLQARVLEGKALQDYVTEGESSVDL